MHVNTLTFLFNRCLFSPNHFSVRIGGRDRVCCTLDTPKTRASLISSLLRMKPNASHHEASPRFPTG